MQLQEDGEIQVFDGFMRECGLLQHPLPAIAKVSHGYKNGFAINVSF